MSIKSLVSVIVPVHNVEQYLRECVKSVLEQTYREVEIVLVDDGSTDRSGELCDALARGDSRVSVIHKSQGGLSSARNRGIEHASGGHLLFLDSDDYWTGPECLEGVLHECQNDRADVLCFGRVRVPDGRSLPRLPSRRSLEVSERSLDGLIQTGRCGTSAWNKLVRSELFASGCLRFPEGMWSEDIPWEIELISRAEIVVGCRYPVYAYRQRLSSVSHREPPELVRIRLVALEAALAKAQLISSTAKKELALSFLASEVLVTLARSYQRPEGVAPDEMVRLRELLPLMDYRISRRVHTVGALCDHLGVDRVGRALGIYLNLRHALSSRRGGSALDRNDRAT
jgi:glycosyltransferase involved in cell wall biosynthesis